ncbi:energy transducer TonB [uncultured Sphingomonas sp.]|uniref:energy transducer TonB n=1 Tax=uncultured Sphingomonas sp. TaxID=158754 RepID=UPI0035CC28F1
MSRYAAPRLYTGTAAMTGSVLLHMAMIAIFILALGGGGITDFWGLRQLIDLQPPRPLAAFELAPPQTDLANDRWVLSDSVSPGCGTDPANNRGPTLTGPSDIADKPGYAGARLCVLIDNLGGVLSVWVLRHPTQHSLERELIRGAHRLTFDPARRDNVPVSSFATLNFVHN